MRAVALLIVFFVAGCAPFEADVSTACINGRVYKRTPAHNFWYESDPQRRCVNAVRTD